MTRAIGVVVLALGVSCASGRGGGTQPSSAPPTGASAVTPPQPAPVRPTPAPAQPVIPDTLAGNTLRAWLDVFNSANEPGLQAFVTTYKGPPAAQWVAFRQQTGGFELISIENSDRLAIEFVVKEKARPRTAVGWLHLKDTEPAEIASLSLLLIPPGLTPADMNKNIDAATRTRVLDAIVARA